MIATGRMASSKEKRIEGSIGGFRRGSSSVRMRIAQTALEVQPRVPKVSPGDDEVD